METPHGRLMMMVPASRGSGAAKSPIVLIGMEAQASPGLAMMLMVLANGNSMVEVMVPGKTGRPMMVAVQIPNGSVAVAAAAGVTARRLRATVAAGKVAIGITVAAGAMMVIALRAGTNAVELPRDLSGIGWM